MKTIILRDNDVNAFTTPALLEKIYGRLWQANMPVSLGVIPQPRGDMRLLHLPDQPYSPAIPAKFHGSNKPYLLRENKILCAYLNEMARQGLVEVCLQGFENGYHEFASNDETLLSQKIEEGKAELERAFPETEIKTFLAPDEKLSPTALHLLTEYGFHICTSSQSLAETDYSFLDNYSRHELPNEQSLFTCDEVLFRYDCSPEDSLNLANQRLNKHDFLIINNHYWAFYRDWSLNRDELHSAWQRFVDNLLALKKAKFTSFSQA